MLSCCVLILIKIKIFNDFFKVAQNQKWLGENSPFSNKNRIKKKFLRLLQNLVKDPIYTISQMSLGQENLE